MSMSDMYGRGRYDDRRDYREDRREDRRDYREDRREYRDRDWDDDGRRRGESWERMGGVDRVLDRAIRLTQELYRLLQSAEAGVDDVVRDLRKAEGIERRAEKYERAGEGLERKAEAIEREARRDLSGGPGPREGRGGRY